MHGHMNIISYHTISSLCMLLFNIIGCTAGVECWHEKQYVDLEKTCRVKSLIKMC